MSKIVTEVVAANQAYARDFGKKGELAMPPARKFAILTCMDARLDPAKYAGLAEGDAHVIRNAGGRATDDAIRSLVISHKLLGTGEWFVVHHTNCGMETFTDDVMGDLLEDDLGTASFDGKKWSKSPSPWWPRGWSSHQVANDKESGIERDTGRALHPRASAGSRERADLWLHLRRQDWPPQ